MGRRLVGGGVIVGVLIVVLAGSALSGPDETGRAVRAAPVAPPAIGTCIDGFVNPAVVPCSERHTGEITLSWTGADLPDPAQFEDLVQDLPYPVEDAAGDAQLLCYLASTGYLGSPPAPTPAPSGFTWFWPGVPMAGEVIQGPAGSRVADWSWSACLLSPAPVGASVTDGYVGTLRGVVADRTLPRDPGWRLCADGPDLFVEQVSCTEPHRVEIIATGELTVPGQQQAPSAWSAYPDTTAQQECSDLADAHLGTEITTYDGDLEASLTLASSSPYADEQGDWATSVSVVCAVGVAEGRTLTDSVAGLAGNPLPWG